MSNTARKHEDFSVESSASKRVHLVRPERFGVTDWKCFLRTEHDQFEVLDYSTFGIAIFVGDTHKTPVASEFEATVCIDRLEVQNVSLRRVYETKLEDGSRKVAFEIFKGELIDVEKISAAIEGLSATKSFHSALEDSDSIDPSFRAQVLEAKDFLSELRNDLSEMEKTWAHLPPQTKVSKEAGVGLAISSFLDVALKKYYSSLEAIVSSKSPEEKIRYLQYFRSKLSELIWEAPFAKRAYDKPLGYAGDFEMMNLIYRDTFEGGDLFSKCLHKFYIDQAAAVAVKNRANYLEGKIQHIIRDHKGKGGIDLLSVASGPAFEVRKFFKNADFPDKEIRFTLLDQDLRALQHAQQNLREMKLKKPHTKIDFHFQHMAIKNVIAKGLQAEAYDLIYSAGLFDYFSDTVALAAMRQLFKALKPGGCLIIGNFDISNPTRPIMEYALDWNLIYRSSDDMKALAKSISPDVSVEKEEKGVNLFVVMRKN